MESLRQALAASIGSRGFSAVIGLIALPWYVQLLGVEAYGVIGLFASLQVLVAFMELGLATTLTRELSLLGSDRERLPYGRSVTVTYEVVYLVLALVIGLLLTIVVSPVASRWVNLEKLTTGEVSIALQLAGIALAFQWPTNLYSAGLAGLHRQTLLAIWTSTFTALRVTLSLAALWFDPSLRSFFTAQIVSALIQSIVMRTLLWQALRLPGHRAVPSMEIIFRSKSFAGGMTAITITSIILMQMDKVILSYLLRLPDFGIYVIASSLATGLYVLISPVFSVIYPRFSALWSSGNVAAVIDLYHSSSQFMAVLILPLTAVMACFATSALFVLTGNEELSRDGSSVLMLLTLGSALNGVMNMPYALQLASGWTSLSVRINLCAIIFLAPLMWFAASKWGAIGGAAAWAVLNAAYFLLTPQILHLRLIQCQKRRWYIDDVIKPAIVCFCIIILIRQFAVTGLSRWSTALQLICYWLIVFIPTFLTMRRLRSHVIKYFWK